MVVQKFSFLEETGSKGVNSAYLCGPRTEWQSAFLIHHMEWARTDPSTYILAMDETTP